MKNRLKLIGFFAASLFTATVNAQAPAPLDSADFHPVLNDTVRIFERTLPSSVTFSTALTLEQNADNDTIPISKALTDEMIGLEDFDLAAVINATGNVNWEINTFIYSSLDAYDWNKIWRKRTAFAPFSGQQTVFPTGMLYYTGLAGTTTTHNFFVNTDTGFFEIGSRVMASSPYNLLNDVPKPVVTYPVDANNPANVDSLYVTTTSINPPATTKTKLDVDVDAYGTLTTYTGDPNNPTILVYPDAIKTTTQSIDTMDASGFQFYVKSLIYTWYVPGIPEQIVIFSAAAVRNNIDPSLWSILGAPGEWHNEIEMSWSKPSNSYMSTLLGGVSKKLSDASFEIYPNPTSGILNVRVGNDLKTLRKMEVVNILGEVVYSNTTPSFGETQIDLSSYAKGTYVVRMTFDEKTTTNKIIVK